MQRSLASEPRAQCFVVLRRQRHAADERAKIEPGAAGHDGALSATADIGQRIQCIVGITCGRIALVRIDEADEMVAHPCRLLVGRRRRADRHAAVDLTRVGPDDFGIEAARKLHCQLRLSARSRPRYDKDA